MCTFDREYIKEELCEDKCDADACRRKKITIEEKSSAITINKNNKVFKCRVVVKTQQVPYVLV